MPNERRVGWLAAFFVLGMVFMLAIIGLSRPEWIVQPDRTRLVKVEATGPVFNPPSEPEPKTEPPTVEEIPSSPVLAETAPPEPAPLPEAAAVEPVAYVVPEPQASVPPVAKPVRKSNRQVTASVRPGRGHRIFGRAVLTGDAPPEKQIPMDPSCGRLSDHPQTTRIFKVGRDKGLADVVITVIDGPRRDEPWPVPNEARVIEARNCFFEPYVSVAQANQPVVIENGDPVLHNAHITPNDPLNLERNYAMLPNSKPLRTAFRSPEHFIRIKCDVHPWMFAYVSIFPHPFFAVTDKDGKFEIKNVPAGKYTVLATHRKAGYFTNVVEVTDRSAPNLNFEFTAASEAASRR